MPRAPRRASSRRSRPEPAPVSTTRLPSTRPSPVRPRALRARAGRRSSRCRRCPAGGLSSRTPSDPASRRAPLPPLLAPAQAFGEVRGQARRVDAPHRALEVVVEAHVLERPRHVVPQQVAGARIAVSRLADARHDEPVAPGAAGGGGGGGGG